jgi:hypothetical protein
VIEDGLHDKLINDATLAGLVSTRLYPLEFPQGGTLPAVVYQKESTEKVIALTGNSGLVAAHFEFAALAATYTAARSVADAVRLALEGTLRETLGDTDSTVVQAILIDDETDQFYPKPEPGVYERQLDVTVWHVETQPA